MRLPTPELRRFYFERCHPHLFYTTCSGRLSKDRIMVSAITMIPARPTTIYETTCGCGDRLEATATEVLDAEACYIEHKARERELNRHKPPELPGSGQQPAPRYAWKTVVDSRQPPARHGVDPRAYMVPVKRYQSPQGLIDDGFDPSSPEYEAARAMFERAPLTPAPPHHIPEGSYRAYAHDEIIIERSDYEGWMQTARARIAAERSDKYRRAAKPAKFSLHEFVATCPPPIPFEPELAGWGEEIHERFGAIVDFEPAEPRQFNPNTGKTEPVGEDRATYIRAELKRREEESRPVVDTGDFESDWWW